MSDAPAEVFVPSVEQSDGSIVGLGVFSSEPIAMRVLKDFLKRTEQMDLIAAVLTKWEIDLIGHEGSTIILRMSNRICPVCQRKTFWFDLNNFNAHCEGNMCGAWIEDNIHDEEIIDCGWPPTRYLHQSRSIKDAIAELKKIGAKLHAAGQRVSELSDAAYAEAFEYEAPKDRKERLMRQFGESGESSLLGEGDEDIPAAEDIPVIEDTPAAEDTPVIEDTPTAEDTVDGQ